MTASEWKNSYPCHQFLDQLTGTCIFCWMQVGLWRWWCCWWLWIHLWWCCPDGTFLLYFCFRMNEGASGDLPFHSWLPCNVQGSPYCFTRHFLECRWTNNRVQHKFKHMSSQTSLFIWSQSLLQSNLCLDVRGLAGLSSVAEVQLTLTTETILYLTSSSYLNLKSISVISTQSENQLCHVNSKCDPAPQLQVLRMKLFGL